MAQLRAKGDCSRFALVAHDAATTTAVIVIAHGLRTVRSQWRSSIVDPGKRTVARDSLPSKGSKPLSKSLKLSVAMVVAALVALTAALVVTRDGGGAESTGGGGAAEPPLVREDSPRLTSGDRAVFVEFLDFECEACGAAHPTIEDLREKYGDEVTFVVRHMPLHGNSMNAALAAEAAGEQDEFEAMHDKLFETQDEWGHSETSQAKTFAGYAEELGLDMQQYRADVKDPATKKRIEQSQSDAKDLGVTGTPTFFLDGEKFEPSTVEDFDTALDDAVKD